MFAGFFWTKKVNKKQLTASYFWYIKVFTFRHDWKDALRNRQTKPNFAPVDNLTQASHKHEH